MQPHHGSERLRRSGHSSSGARARMLMLKDVCTRNTPPSGEARPAVDAAHAPAGRQTSVCGAMTRASAMLPLWPQQFRPLRREPSSTVDGRSRSAQQTDPITVGDIYAVAHYRKGQARAV
mmetsp:Transcript_14948/g.42496  ORF Transcript_14948/g.42496 Transcript_14948/m.42496 type:complete len:120 (+) Transcript_14948:178-537(+)